jgi:NAD(P)H-dependent FMN reductase
LFLTVRVVAISGSLQQSSSNAELLRVAAEVAPDGMVVEPARSIATLPHFNPDVEATAPPPEVVAFRTSIGNADGVLIASPEYAFGVPGALKNALDWLVGSGDLYGKAVVVLSAAPSADRGANARADLERTLRGQGADVRHSATIAVPKHDRDEAAIREAVAAALAEFRFGA